MKFASVALFCAFSISVAAAQNEGPPCGHNDTLLARIEGWTFCKSFMPPGFRLRDVEAKRLEQLKNLAKAQNDIGCAFGGNLAKGNPRRSQCLQDLHRRMAAFCREEEVSESLVPVERNQSPIGNLNDLLISTIHQKSGNALVPANEKQQAREMHSLVHELCKSEEISCKDPHRRFLIF